ncbi:hypothetical protein ACFLQV_03775 [Calditrichota bacterium]
MSELGHGANPSGYEKKDADPKRLLVFAISSALIIVVIIFGVNEYFVIERERTVDEMVLQPESMEMREVRAHAAEMLNGYAVIDSAAGVYRIPIQRAMQLEAEEAFKMKKRSK